MESTARSFDQSKAEAFAGELLYALNHAGLCLMASIGHRTGLFDGMRDLPPSTSHEIARAANLNERYVREWLGAMVTAGVVDVDPTSSHYSLPPEHAAMLTRAAGADNVGVWAQLVPMLGAVEDEVVMCFATVAAFLTKSSPAFMLSWPRTRPSSRRSNRTFSR